MNIKRKLAGITDNGHELYDYFDVEESQHGLMYLTPIKQQTKMLYTHAVIEWNDMHERWDMVELGDKDGMRTLKERLEHRDMNKPRHAQRMYELHAIEEHHDDETRHVRRVVALMNARDALMEASRLCDRPIHEIADIVASLGESEHFAAAASARI